MEIKNPEGYRKLLAYQKAQKLHDDVLEMVKHFPQTPYRHTQDQNGKTKTIGDLADQMSRSGRSTHKNIVEGWKRTSTKEYFDFLSFSIGSNGELKDDSADIVCGKYHELKGLNGVMEETDWQSFTELDKVSFYPLDEKLSPAVKIFLKAKEVDYLLHRLQDSLDKKMDRDNTKSVNQKILESTAADRKNDAEFLKYMENLGLRRLENGQFVEKEKGSNGKNGE